MEPWQGGGAPWCIGSVFPAPQLLTGAAAIPLGPLLFDGIGTPQRLLSTGSPLPLFESFTPSISEQKEEFLSFPGDVYVPEDILEEHLEEDTVVRKAIGVYRSQILGNRLQLVECRDGDVALFFPTGNNGDRIGSTVCSRDNTVKRWHDASSHQSVLNSTSVPLRQPIFQLSAVRKDAWDPDCGFLVAARSLYNVQFLAANQEKSEVRFSRPTAASFAKYVSHVAWNQHVQGEAAVVVETGEVLLFDLHRGWSTNKVNAKASYNLPQKQQQQSNSMHHNASFRTRRISRPRAKMAMHKKKVKPPPVSSPFEWWQCEYAWHPKILLLASSREVSLMDFRASHNHKADHHQNLNNNASVVVARIPGVGRTAGYLNRATASEAISSFARGDQEGSSYEFCISTKKHLLLFDTRQPLTPFLQWLHGMDAEPPSVLAMCPIPSSSQGSSDKGKVILAASFHSGNIQAFCYGPHPSPASPPQNTLTTPSTPSHLDERTYAWGLPSKVIAPQGTRNSWATILDSDMNFFQQREISKVKQRKWDRLAGFIVLPSQTQNQERGFSLMELSGDGDLLAQQFQAADKLRSVGPPHVSPLHSSLNSDPTGIKSRAKRCNVTKLEHFLNYIRNGSSKKKSSKEPDDDDVTMESGLTSEEDHQYALVPYNKSLSSSSINQPDHAFALQLHEDYNREKLTTLVAETLQQTNVPLSLYEISHVVLRRYLPPSLSRLAAGMPADTRSPQRRRYISILQTSQLPPDTAGAIVEYHNSQEEEDEAASLSSLTVPLPALLAPNSSTSSTTTVLEQGCDHVRRALVHSLLASSNSTGAESTDLSLADSVEAWNSSNNGDESSTSRLVQYQTSDRESVLPRFHGKPIRGQALDMTSEEHLGAGDCFDGGGGVRSFYGVLAEGGGNHEGKVLEDDHLCPIQLPFRESSEGGKTSGLSSLRDQFKQWQQSFVPYQNFCRNRLPNL